MSTYKMQIPLDNITHRSHVTRMQNNVSMHQNNDPPMIYWQFTEGVSFIPLLGIVAARHVQRECIVPCNSIPVKGQGVTCHGRLCVPIDYGSPFPPAEKV